MISLVPQDQITNVWSQVEPLIQKAVDILPGRYDTIDIMTDLMMGNLQLWIGFEKDLVIHSAGVTRIYDTPKARILAIEWLGGERLSEWMQEALDITENFARDNECSKVEIRGRRGWGRKLGWKELNYTFEKDL